MYYVLLPPGIKGLKFSGLKESTIHSFKTRVIKKIKDASKKQREVKQLMKKHSKPTNRPLLLGELDEMVQSYIKAVDSRGALMNSSLAITAGEALVQKYPYAVGNIDSSSWARSIFKRMGCVRRIKTSSKVKIPDGTRPEIEFRSWNSHHDRKAYSWLDDHKY